MREFSPDSTLSPYRIYPLGSVGIYPSFLGIFLCIRDVGGFLVLKMMSFLEWSKTFIKTPLIIVSKSI